MNVRRLGNVGKMEGERKKFWRGMKDGKGS